MPRGSESESKFPFELGFSESSLDDDSIDALVEDGLFLFEWIELFSPSKLNYFYQHDNFIYRKQRNLFSTLVFNPEIQPKFSPFLT